jgi:acetylglutamate kinase
MKYLVIKCGGSVMESLPLSFFQNIVDLYVSGKIMPVIVHGGGPIISSLLEKLGIQTQFVNGIRKTTDEVLDIVEMVLSGSVNKQIVRKISEANGHAWGISGVDGMLLQAVPTCDWDVVGFVGDVVQVNKNMITTILTQGYIPVISPIGIDEKGQHYNINGDIAASAIAQELKAGLCMITDIPGIYKEVDGEKIVFQSITKQEIEQLIQDGTISSGMVPKVKAAIDGLVHNVPEVVIINGMEKNSLLKFAEGKKVGTKIVISEECLHVY